nr:hypothetical protein CFP56_19147 [Quercus suber]
MAVLEYIRTKYDGDKEKVITQTQYFRDRIGSFDRDHALSTSMTTHLESVDDSSEVKGIELGTFGQPIGLPTGFSENDDENANLHDIDDLCS